MVEIEIEIEPFFVDRTRRCRLFNRLIGNRYKSRLIDSLVKNRLILKID